MLLIEPVVKIENDFHQVSSCMTEHGSLAQNRHFDMVKIWSIPPGFKVNYRGTQPVLTQPALSRKCSNFLRWIA